MLAYAALCRLETPEEKFNLILIYNPMQGILTEINITKWNYHVQLLEALS